MVTQLEDDVVAAEFFSPLEEVFNGRLYQYRKCGGIPDEVFCKIGVLRCMRPSDSGRDFIQWLHDIAGDEVVLATFFEALKSPRRQLLVEEVAARLWRLHQDPLYQVQQGPLAGVAELDGRGIYALDATELAHPHHAPRTWDDTRLGVKYNFVRCLRSSFINCLGTCGGPLAKEHEVTQLKRCGVLKLEDMFAAGSVVVVDRGYVEGTYWEGLRKRHKISCIIRLKKNIVPVSREAAGWDRSDPVNAGVTSVEVLQLNGGGRWLLVEFTDPETGCTYQFLSNDLGLRPGVVAYLHKLRWRIEKTYDFIKNALGEQAGWANSKAARSAQGLFIELAMNLIAIFSARHAPPDEKVRRRRAERIEKAAENAAKRGAKIPSLVAQDLQPSKYSLQFIRWLRNHILHGTALTVALIPLADRMANYI